METILIIEDDATMVRGLRKNMIQKGRSKYFMVADFEKSMVNIKKIKL